MCCEERASFVQDVSVSKPPTKHPKNKKPAHSTQAANSANSANSTQTAYSGNSTNVSNREVEAKIDAFFGLSGDSGCGIMLTWLTANCAKIANILQQTKTPQALGRVVYVIMSVSYSIVSTHFMVSTLGVFALIAHYRGYVRTMQDIGYLTFDCFVIPLWRYTLRKIFPYMPVMQPSIMSLQDEDRKHFMRTINNIDEKFVMMKKYSSRMFYTKFANNGNAVDLKLVSDTVHEMMPILNTLYSGISSNVLPTDGIMPTLKTYTDMSPSLFGGPPTSALPTDGIKLPSLLGSASTSALPNDDIIRSIPQLQVAIIYLRSTYHNHNFTDPLTRKMAKGYSTEIKQWLDQWEPAAFGRKLNSDQNISLASQLT